MARSSLVGGGGGHGPVTPLPSSSKRRGLVLTSARVVVIIAGAATLFFFGLGFGLLYNMHGEDAQSSGQPWNRFVGLRRSIADQVRDESEQLFHAPRHPALRKQQPPAAPPPPSDVQSPAVPETPSKSEAKPPQDTIESPRGDDPPTRSETETHDVQLEQEPNAPDTFVSLRGDKGIQLPDTVVDFPDMSFLAWIFLDSSMQYTRKDIQSIASIRDSGCGRGQRHLGWHFYVNEWQTDNGALRLEWGAGEAGCITLTSDPGSIPVDRWVHVGFAFQTPRKETGSPGRALLFKDGKLLKQAEIDERPLQTAPGFNVAITNDVKYGWGGKLAHVLITRSVVTPSQLQNFLLYKSEAAWRHVTNEAKEIAAISLICSTPTKCQDLISGQEMRTVSTSGGPITSVSQNQESTRASQTNQHVEGPKPVIKDSTNPGIRKSSRPPPSGPIDIKAASRSLPEVTEEGNQWIRKLMRLSPDSVEGDTQSVESLIRGTWDDRSTVEERRKSDEIGRERAETVRNAMRHSWKGYSEKAFGADEIAPRSGRRIQNWGGMGMTLIDSLDTLYIMGLEKEFEAAAQWVEEHFNPEPEKSVSVFETNIRALGGLLGAYELSKREGLLTKAEKLAERLLQAFNTATGIPKSAVNLKTGRVGTVGWAGSQSVLSEIGTLQLEFRHLSWLTGEPKYAVASENIIHVLKNSKTPDTVPEGLYPVYINPNTGAITHRLVSFGALGDSFYEYLLKVWLQGGELEEEKMYRQMYDTAIESMFTHMVAHSNTKNYEYVPTLSGRSKGGKMEHLTCFVPGMVALGAYKSKGTERESKMDHDLQHAKAMMYTCFKMYDHTATGLSPETVIMGSSAEDMSADKRGPFYMLRPEVVESLYVLHQLTGHPIYREWGWKMFQSIERYCKLPYGYGHFPDVNNPGRQADDRQESFFLAETLKYHYMLQSPDHPISLDKFVFNTEAHPVRRFDFSER